MFGEREDGKFIGEAASFRFVEGLHLSKWLLEKSYVYLTFDSSEMLDIGDHNGRDFFESTALADSKVGEHEKVEQIDGALFDESTQFMRD